MADRERDGHINGPANPYQHDNNKHYSTDAQIAHMVYDLDYV